MKWIRKLTLVEGIIGNVWSSMGSVLSKEYLQRQFVNTSIPKQHVWLAVMEAMNEARHAGRPIPRNETFTEGALFVRLNHVIEFQLCLHQSHEPKLIKLPIFQTSMAVQVRFWSCHKKCSPCGNLMFLHCLTIHWLKWLVTLCYNAIKRNNSKCPYELDMVVGSRPSLLKLQLTPIT